MKKILTIILVIAIFTLISCQKKEVVSTSTETTISESETSQVATESIATEENSETKVEKKEYPRVDGSTANMPMMAQIRSSYLGESLEEAQNNTEVTTTDYAWRNMLEGKNDILLVYEPSEETKKIIDSSNVKLRVTPIGVDALVFIVNEKNPVNNLSTKQLQDIYSGKITNWKAVGGEDKKIEAYQRVLNSGSQTLFLNLLMKDVKPVDAPKKYRIEGMDGLIEEIASYNDSANALGYSVFYYAKKMYAVPGLKLLSVDGVEPNDTTILNKQYPFLNQYYLVIRDDANTDSNPSKLYEYIVSDKGAEDIKNAGYIPYKGETFVTVDTKWAKDSK